MSCTHALDHLRAYELTPYRSSSTSVSLPFRPHSPWSCRPIARLMRRLACSPLASSIMARMTESDHYLASSPFSVYCTVSRKLGRRLATSKAKVDPRWQKSTVFSLSPCTRTLTLVASSLHHANKGVILRALQGDMKIKAEDEERDQAQYASSSRLRASPRRG